MREAELRALAYLFKLRLTADVRRAIERLSRQGEWVDSGQGWQAKETNVRLKGWSRQRRIIVLRRRVKGALAAPSTDEQGQLRLTFQDIDPGEDIWEYQVLATSLVEELGSFGQLDRVRWEIDIDQAWRLSRFCCWGGVSAFDPWRGLPPMRRGRSNCFQGRDRLGIRQDQFGALGAGASAAARQSALLDPGVKGRLRHPDFFGEFANRPFVRPALDPRRTSAIFDGLCA